MIRNIPIALVRAFEAAGRTGSFKSAAVELNLSPSAVSHSVRKLEQHLGTALFERTGRRVVLNPDGEELIRHVGRAFDHLRYGFEIVSARAPGLLRLHCAPSFATQWLTPRLSRLLEEIPGLDIRLAAGTDYTRFETDEFDADIVYGQVRQSGLDSLPLGEESVTPLCAPHVAKRIKTPEDLIGELRIESDNKQVRWSDWFAANSLPAPRPNGSRFDRSFLALAFAADGMGVALESTMLAERELRSGALVAPLAKSSRSVCYVGHQLVFPRVARPRKVLRLFTTWIAKERGIDASAILPSALSQIASGKVLTVREN